MTAPLFLVDPGALDGVRHGGSLVLDGAEGRHAAGVRRIRAGERVDVADGAGRLARCAVAGAGADRLDLLVEHVEEVPPAALRVVLAQALAKGGRDELAVQAATELGVDAVLPWAAARSVVVWRGERGERAHARWSAVVREAAKQSRRAWVPTVLPACDTAGLAARVRQTRLALLLLEDAGQRLLDVELPPRGDVLVIVGPEGGVDDAERSALLAAGARGVRLGPEVLRSSTAGPAALVALAVRAGRW